MKPFTNFNKLISNLKIIFNQPFQKQKIHLDQKTNTKP
jgi:hypothetical protein